MDITLSILAGLGLRVFLFAVADPGASNKAAIAMLGLWEGAILHQVSGRSSSPNVDHILAYGLRLAVDFLVSKSLPRMIMLVLWTALGTVSSEIILPHSVIRSALKKQRDRERDRRHRHSRSIPAAVPIIAAPLPPRVRAYRPPEQSETTPVLPENPPPQTSTPIFSSDQPPTPPSFFLYETNVSPSPKPVYLPTLHSAESSPKDALPVRPRSGLASTFNRSPESVGSPPPLPVLLPTPPDSAQSANILAEGQVESQNNDMYDNQILGFAPDLAPIPELSSSENVTPHIDDIYVPEVHDNDDTMRRVPDWLATQATATNTEALFLHPFSPTASPSAALPVPVPMPVRQQSSLWHLNLNNSSPPSASQHGEEHKVVETEAIELEDPHVTDHDELRTPATRDAMHLDSDNEYDSDPLQTPRRPGYDQDEDQLDPLQTPRRPDLDQEEDQLSPLVLNVRSSLPENEIANDIGPTAETANVIVEDEEDDYAQMPGSLSQNILLQPPLPTSPLFHPRPPSPSPASPPPPSPSTIMSDPSDISVLSTRIPSKLYSRADTLRQKARDEEKLRARLDEERRLAEHQGRTMDVLRLKVQIRDMDAAAQKLHEKAARRYFVCKLARITLWYSNSLELPVTQQLVTHRRNLIRSTYMDFVQEKLLTASNAVLSRLTRKSEPQSTSLSGRVFTLRIKSLSLNRRS